MRHQRVADVQLVDALDRRHGFDVVVMQAMAGVDDQAFTQTLGHAVDNALQLGGDFARRGRIGITPGVQFDGRRTDPVRGFDLALEEEAIPLLKDAVAHSESVRDYVSRDLFGAILASEEHHVDELEKQFEMIERMGIENYIQLQSKPSGED
eukprot:gene46595-58097_t